MTAPVDLQRIADLIAKLERLCREAQELRDAIAGMTARVVTWPESRREPGVFDAPTSDASAPPPGRAGQA